MHTEPLTLTDAEFAELERSLPDNGSGSAVDLTQSSYPQMLPVGLITRDTLLAVTDKEYRYRPEHGPVHVYLRK